MTNNRDRALVQRAARVDSYHPSVLNREQADYLVARGLFDAQDWRLTGAGFELLRAVCVHAPRNVAIRHNSETGATRRACALCDAHLVWV